ncbi:MAG: cohesin domain-containing protein [Clostridia bacterium]|nr:cohesin domain-containing protein [Clostridia bacterium]
MKKIAILFMTAIIISAFAVGVSFAADGAISVTDAEGYAGKTVKVDVAIADNPGSIASVMTVKYDTEGLTLTRVEDAGKMGENKHSDNLSADEYYLSWFNPLAEENYSFNGTVVTLSFEIAEDAALGDYDITVEVNEAYDTDLNPVTYVETAGKVTVVEAPPYILGDIDMDGEVKLSDAVLLFRHSLNQSLYPVDYSGDMDFTGDGKVTIDDAVLIFRHSLNPGLYPLD